MFILQEVAFTYLQLPIVFKKKLLNTLIQNFFMCIQRLSQDQKFWISIPQMFMVTNLLISKTYFSSNISRNLSLKNTNAPLKNAMIKINSEIIFRQIKNYLDSQTSILHTIQKRFLITYYYETLHLKKKQNYSPIQPKRKKKTMYMNAKIVAFSNIR